MAWMGLLWNRRSRPAVRIGLIVAAVVVMVVLCCLPRPAVQAEKPATLQLERYDGGFFHIDRPTGWQLVTAGECAHFAFLLRDPAQPLRQIFYFGEVGPVYMFEGQRQIDQQYVNYGGYPVAWIDMPTVNPLTAANFFQQFHQIARSQVAQQFMPQAPRLENLQVVSTEPLACPIQGGSTQLVRALFLHGGTVGEGLFVATVAPAMPYTGGPGGGTGYGFMVVGITAPKSEFGGLQSQLSKVIESFTISQQYASRCIQQQQQAYAGIMRAGQTLRETSDLIMNSWESRNRTEDIQAEKFSDYIRDRERLYDPNSGTVYEFENGFYDRYDVDRQQYDMNNLQLLPSDNYNLWMESPLDGPRHLR